MSTSIDNRVVGLQFDNRQFEKNVDGTLKSLDKLEASLKFKGAQKGFSDLEQASSRCDLSHIGKAAEVIQQRFSAMGIMGMTVLTRLANKAVTVGEQMLKSLTIAPVSQGYQEYELKMGSIQTIMASTGESLDTVNGYLRELNEYSDKTIYSFSDMTNNIGKFTNAGVKLEDAVKAIQGISNEAAVSGANAQQASHAMYNFAQALSAGSVKLIDWKSIENANMATIEFKKQLIETALEVGTLRTEGDKYVSTTTNIQGSVSDAFTATSMFNESLNSQWMSTEVLVKTLGKYSDANTEIGKKAFAAAQDVKTFSQLMDTLKEAVGSGWSETWEIIFGDFETAKKRYTEISNFIGGIIGDISNARNAMLSSIFDSPWKKLTTQLGDAGVDVNKFNEELIKLAEEGGADVQEMLENGMTMEDLAQNGVITGGMITKILNKFTESVSGANEATSEVVTTMTDLKSVVDAVIMGDFGSGEDRVRALTEAGYDYATVQDLVNKTLWGEEVQYEQLSEAQLESLGYTEDEISAIQELANEANTTGSSMAELIANINRPGGGQLIFDTLSNTFKGIYSVVNAIKQGWREAFKFDPSGIYKILEWFHKMSEKLVMGEDQIKSITKMFSTFFGVVNKVASKLYHAISSIFSAIGSLFPEIDVNFDSVIPKITSMLQSFSDWIDDIGSSSVDIGKFAVSMQALVSKIPGIDKLTTRIKGFKDTISSFTDSKLQGGFTKITTAFSNFWKTLTSFDISSWKKNPAEFISNMADRIGEKFKELRTTISDGLSWLSDKMDFDAGDVLGMASMMGIGLGLIKIIQIFSKVGKAVSKIGEIVVSLKSVVKTLGKAGKKFINSGSKFIKSLSRIANAEAFKKAAFGMLELAGAVAVLAGAMWIMSKIPKEDMLRSGIAVLSLVGILSIITIATTKLSGSGGLISIAAIIGAIFLLVVAVKMLNDANLTWTVDQLGYLAEMLVTIALLMGAVALFNKLGADLVRGAASIAIISGAIVLLAVALKIISTINMAALTDNIDSIALMLGLLASLAIVAALAGKNAAKGGLGLLAITASLYLLVPMLFVLAKLPKRIVKQASKSLYSIMGVFAIIMLTTRLAGKNAHKAAATILAMSFALIPIAGIVYLLGSMDPVKCAQGTKAIMLIMLGFGAMAAMASSVQSGIGVIIALSVAVVAMGLVIGALSMMEDPMGVLASAAALTLLMLSLTAMMAVAGTYKQTWGNIAKFTIQLALLLGAVMALAAILVYLTQIEDPNKALTMVGIMGVLLGELLIVLGVCTLVGAMGPAALYGLLALDAVILNFGILLGIFAGLEQLFPGTQAFLETGIPLLTTIGSAIGQFIGSFLGGIAEGMMESLINAAEMFETFCVTITDASSKLNIPEDFGSTLVDIATAFLAISGGRFLNGISDLLGFGSFESLGTQMEGLGGGISALFTATKGLTKEDLDRVKIAAEAGKAMTEMASLIPNSGGVLGWLVGENDMGTFASQFESFGTGIVALSKSGVDIDEDGIKKIKDAGIAIAEMADAIPNTGGILGDIVGNNDMDTFKSQFTGFGTALKTLSQSGVDISQEGITNIKNAGLEIASMADELPNTGGIWGDIVGNNDMDDFGDRMVTFGEDLTKLSQESSKINISGISKFIRTVSDIIALDVKLSGENSDALSKLITKSTEAIAEYNRKILESGENFATGFSTGIANKAYLSKEAARIMAENALNKLNETLDEHSPSRESAISGKFFVEGFAGAVRKYTTVSDRASEQLGKSSLLQLRSSISKFGEILNGDADLQPVIRPVVDMSDVDRSFSDLSARYNHNQVIGIDAAQQRIRTAAYIRDSETLSALKHLDADIRGMNNTSYTINGINVGSDAEVNDAIKTLVRATRIGRRN